jgi:aminopeptidase
MSSNDAARQGARNLVSVCLAVKKGERVILICDEETREVSGHLEEAAKEIGAVVQRFMLERPETGFLEEVPEEIRGATRSAHVSIFAASARPGEVDFRKRYRMLVEGHTRHGHMPGVTLELLCTGMLADYNEVAALTRRIFEIASKARTARVKGEGSDLKVEFAPGWRWAADTGLFHNPGEWGNLPSGETFTAPYRLEGTIATPLLGDWLSEKFGVQDPPIIFEIKNSWINLDSIRGGSLEAREAFREYLQQDPNGPRASEFAIGTNIALKELVGNLLQDEKFPGVHVAFGDPYGEITGAPWSAKTHIDVILPGVSLWLDEIQILDRGKFLV